MSLEGVDRLPVVNNAMSGKVVGVVSALDVLTWFARLSGYPRQAQRAGN
jgi:CBS domain-containing protein